MDTATATRSGRRLPEPRLDRPLQPVRLPERVDLVEWAEEHKLGPLPHHGRIPDAVSHRYISYRLRTRRRLISQAQGRHPTTHR